MLKNFAILLGLAAAACSDSSPSTAITNAPLEGSVGGNAWSFKAGNTDAFLSEGQDDFFAVFYPVAYTACGSEPTGDHLIVALPKVAGTYPMTLQRNMTFVVGDNNFVATQGQIRVDTVTATQITGGLHGIYNGDNEVDGTFTLTVCAQ
jgi:hypothetical protein